MLNTQKLLYIFPDLAYIAELLPGKKEYSFTIHSFRQINGEFIDETAIIPANVEKLFTKLEKEEYHLILPDFLFTNTIVTIQGTTESTVLDHVQKKLLPELELSKETHDIQTTVLTSFKGNSRVQISAIEKSVLAPIRAAVQASEATITAVSPLTWTAKSIISLEPSISVLQVGSQLYTALHYIGVDQTNNFPMDDYEAIVETVKTLKGSEPSVQSLYLSSNSLIEEDLKEKLSGTLPIQQLVSFKEDDSQMPSYVKFIIESTMKTLSIADFPVPKFKLGKASAADLLTLEKTEEVTQKEDTTEEVTEDLDDDTDTDLPQPTKQPLIAATPAIVGASIVSASAETALAPDIEKIEEPEAEVEEIEEIEEITEVATPVTEKTEEVTSMKEESEPKSELKDEPKVAEEKIQEPAEVDLSQFASKDSDSDISDTAVAVDLDKKDVVSTKTLTQNIDKSEKKVIKNSSGVQNMLKMVFITVAVFFITIAIGVGAGIGLLKLSEQKAPVAEPTVIVEATPTPTPEPTPSPEAINTEELSILIVNATTKAGYAGKIKALLVDAKITEVTATNAKGEYELGTDYLLAKEENPQLQELLETATSLTFEYSNEVAIEDPAEKYDAVIVLAD